MVNWQKVVLLLVLLSMPLTLTASSPPPQPFNITFQGNWNADDMCAVHGAVIRTGAALSQYTGHAASTSFNAVYGHVTFIADPKMGWYGIASSGRVRLRPGKISERLVVHELGHVFERRHKELNGVGYSGTGNPIDLLLIRGVYTLEGQFVTGRLYGNYRRNNNQRAPLNGYYADTWQSGYQFHSRWQYSSGNNAFEDWADMFLNWVYGSFYPNPAGNALHTWVSAGMPAWINDMTDLTILGEQSIVDLRRLNNYLPKECNPTWQDLPTGARKCCSTTYSGGWRYPLIFMLR